MSDPFAMADAGSDLLVQHIFGRRDGGSSSEEADGSTDDEVVLPTRRAQPPGDPLKDPERRKACARNAALYTLLARSAVTCLSDVVDCMSVCAGSFGCAVRVAWTRPRS